MAGVADDGVVGGLRILQRVQADRAVPVVAPRIPARRERECEGVQLRPGSGEPISAAPSPPFAGSSRCGSAGWLLRVSPQKVFQA